MAGAGDTIRAGEVRGKLVTEAICELRVAWDGWADSERLLAID